MDANASVFCRRNPLKKIGGQNVLQQMQELNRTLEKKGLKNITRGEKLGNARAAQW